VRKTIPSRDREISGSDKSAEGHVYLNVYVKEAPARQEDAKDTAGASKTAFSSRRLRAGKYCLLLEKNFPPDVYSHVKKPLGSRKAGLDKAGFVSDEQITTDWDCVPALIPGVAIALQSLLFPHRCSIVNSGVSAEAVNITPTGKHLPKQVIERYGNGESRGRAHKAQGKRFYIDRAIGGDCYYRHPDGDIDAGAEESQEPGAEFSVPGKPQELHTCSGNVRPGP
jgi:hypothetical protein